MRLSFRVTFPPPPNLARMIPELEKGVQRFVDKKVAPEFKKTYRTWRRKPKFITRRRRQGSRFKVSHTTNSKIYRFVSGGTRVRYATMTPNFSAKTVPNQIISRVGRGGVAYISRRRPRPGIKARKFEQAIYRKWRGKFAPHMRPYFSRAIQKGFRR